MNNSIRRDSEKEQSEGLKDGLQEVPKVISGPGDTSP
jgi:hypothetical protein